VDSDNGSVYSHLISLWIVFFSRLFEFYGFPNGSSNFDFCTTTHICVRIVDSINGTRTACPMSLHPSFGATLQPIPLNHRTQNQHTMSTVRLRYGHEKTAEIWSHKLVCTWTTFIRIVLVTFRADLLSLPEIHVHVYGFLLHFLVYCDAFHLAKERTPGGINQMAKRRMYRL